MIYIHAVTIYNLKNSVSCCERCNAIYLLFQLFSNLSFQSKQFSADMTPGQGRLWGGGGGGGNVLVPGSIPDANSRTTWYYLFIFASRKKGGATWFVGEGGVRLVITWKVKKSNVPKNTKLFEEY